ncbi:hypothetical protein BGW38_003565 [Lunasporangiospora selenospora]|uniref:RNI-like protein n=1 Tax=Lunasporangiospora selenospora TaxID=979761 RepID=A0A9P6G0C7_9FUNG|nr:hypothetical protein BGW38_003565 [Lunasporangiospora selenospora]
MVRLSRNQSLPTPSHPGASLRKASTNVFSFPTLNLTRTSSERSLSATRDESNSRSSSKSRTRSRSGSSAVIPLAPIIAAIQRGNFVMLSEMDLDVLIKDMTGKDSKVLEALNITSSSVSASDAKILAKLIKSSDAANIKTLKMEGNTISQQATKLMFEAWKFNKTITTLSLARSGANDKTVKYLSRVIVKNETLRTLDLSGNNITAEGAEILAEAMIYNRGVTRLCIQSNNIKRAGAPHLAKILAKNRVLRHLNVGSNSLGPEGVTHIAEAVRFNRYLYSLSLDMNEMGVKGATAIAGALVSNRHLTHLYLPHNNIRDSGLAEICESLKRNKHLICLDLELNHIGLGESDLGMKALGEILKLNTSLREINLSFNMLTTPAVKVLSEGISKNSTLESISLNNCRLTTDSARILASVLPQSTGLQNLGLTSNPDIDVDGYWALASNLTKNRSLKGIQLDYNSEDRQAIYEMFQNSLTRNHIWQQAIYSAACRILVLSRIVLLGRPMNEHLYRIPQQSQGHHHHSWNIFRRVKLGRSNSSNSLASLLSLGKSHHHHHVHSNGADGGGAEGDVVLNSTHGNSYSRQVATVTNGSGPRNMLRQASNSSLLSRHGSKTKGAADGHQQQSHHQSHHSNSMDGVVHHDEPQYEPHKMLANLCTMPHEIFENVCAFLDPGRTMSIAQIRVTVRAAGV